tara:strand:- start:372 stop:539 length:168 start_codon:yes stop_codon:yes gene_type:complete
MDVKYTVSIDGIERYTDITELEYLDLMEDLADEFYQTGTPHPDSITFTTKREPNA